MKRELILGCVVMSVFSSCSQMGKSEMPSQSPRATEIRTAMNRSVIPMVDLENVKVEDALKYWDETSTSYDPRHFKFVHVVSYPMTYSMQPTVTGTSRTIQAVVPAPPSRKVTVRRKNITAKRLLDEICHQSNLVWTIMGREIVVRPKPAGVDASR